MTLICLTSDDVEEGRTQLNKAARNNNLRVNLLGDLVNTYRLPDINLGKRVRVLQFDDSVEGLSRNPFEAYLILPSLRAYL